jgi:uncharacterized protein (DUF2235 family)
MKRLIVCSDGTWNSPDQQFPTNVVRISDLLAPQAPDGTPQIVFYDQGVGTGNFLDRIPGGALGQGLDKNIEDAYRFLMNNYSDGDEVFLFGFSRGAYTVRSAGGLIRKCGLLRKPHAQRFQQAYGLYRRRDPTADSPDAVAFRQSYSREIDIKFIGVWDTVGALGVPVSGLGRLSSEKYEFHNTQLSRRVKFACQAIAIDERRSAFRPTLWTGPPKPDQVVEQAWFAGVHCDVGGGYAARGLADVTLNWMIGKARARRLAFLEDDVAATVVPGPLDTLHNSRTGLYRLTRSIVRQLGTESPATEALHRAAKARHEDQQVRYAPENLLKYLRRPDPRLTG